MSQSLETPAEVSATTTDSSAKTRFRWIGWSTLFFAILQSVCTAFYALNGLQLLIGAAAFASALGAMKSFDKYVHNDAVRIPMVVFAVIGALFNLVAFWQVRRLRARSASAWRQKPVSAGKRTSEWTQLILSLLTLFILALESFYHYKTFHHL
jgi:hypothetical protein